MFKEMDGMVQVWIYINGTLVIDDATVDVDYNAILFDVNNNDIIETIWTMGS